MPVKYFLTFCAGFLFFLQSCKKEDYHNEIEYKASYNAWLKFKTDSNNSYIYTTQRNSWTGHSGRMIITVNHGKIVARNYMVTGPDNENEGVVKTYEEWQEDEATLNFHTSVGTSLTLDKVYEKAKNEWLKADEKNNYIHFEAKNNGMISSCGYVPKGCADDCFMGITITEIKKKN